MINFMWCHMPTVPPLSLKDITQSLLMSAKFAPDWDTPALTKFATPTLTKFAGTATEMALIQPRLTRQQDFVEIERRLLRDLEVAQQTMLTKDLQLMQAYGAGDVKLAERLYGEIGYVPPCDACRGTGEVRGEECWHCEGEGIEV